MKQIFTILSLTIILGACNNSSKDDASSTLQVSADTLNAHNAAADRANQIEMSALSDTLYTSQGQYIRIDAIPRQAVAVKRAQPVARTYTRTAPRTIRTAPVYTQPAPVKESAPVSVPTETAGTTTGAGVGNGNETVGAGTGVEPTNGTIAEAPVDEKKGWSKAAKGAVIGGATGAVAGAIFGKNKAAGAVIGGILGAGGGYAIGRSKDKKDGRY